MGKNADLLARRQAAVPRGVATASPAFAETSAGTAAWGVSQANAVARPGVLDLGRGLGESAGRYSAG